MGKRHKEVAFLEFERWGFDHHAWSPRTRHDYVAIAKRADRWLAENRRVSVFLARARDLQAFLFSTRPDPRSRNHIRQALIAFCEFLVDQGFSEVNEAKTLPRLPEPESVPKALPDDKAKAVIRAAKVFGPRTEAMLLMLALGGLRAEEAMTLEWSNVDLDGGWLRFKGKGRGGKSKTREVPIHPDLGRALRRWRFHSDSPRWVFPSPRRQGVKPLSASYWAREVREVGEMAGVDHLHPHQLRHTFATHLLEGCENIRTVQVALGHVSLSTTQIYTKVRPPKLKEAVNAMDYSGRGDASVEVGDEITGDGSLEGGSPESESVDRVLRLDAEPDPG